MELQKFSEGDPEKAKAYTHLASKFYNTITGLPHDNVKIHKEHSSIFFQELIFWYTLRLYYVYHVTDAKLLQGEGLAPTKLLVDQALSGVKRVINRYEEKAYISYEHIESLVDAFAGANFLPQPFRAESVKSALRPFFNKALGDYSVEFEKRASQGIDREIVAQIEAEFYKWYEVQNLLVQQFKGQDKPAASFVLLKTACGHSFCPVSQRRPLTI